MSLGLLLAAARDTLRASSKMIAQMPGASSKAKNYIGIQPDGHPPANMGDWYVALDEVGVTSTEKVVLDETYQIAIWITKRTGKYAQDRRDDVYLDENAGLDKIERAILASLHGNEAVWAAANMLGGLPNVSFGDGFIQPLWYAGRGKTVTQGGEWAGSVKENDAFAVRQLRFAGAQRIQNLSIMG